MSEPNEELLATPRPPRSRKRAAKAESAAAEAQNESATEATATAGRQEGAQAAGATVGHGAAEATARAEAMLDQTGQRFGHWLSDAGHRLRVFGARAREEAEDIWAEAQSVRHHEES